ncbi:MAG: GreA/GreB family elongation factor [Thermoanaerobaculia bacterium]
MTIPRNIRRLIEAAQFDAVEDDWLEHMETQPEDLDYFAGVARPLAAAGEPDRCRLLLDLVDDHFEKNGLWERRLDLLKRAGDLRFEPQELHSQILDTLHRLYPDLSTFEGLAEKLGLYRAIEDTPKIWQKVERLRGLLQFEQGAVVWMEGKGAGRVLEANLELENFKIDFESHPGLRVGFRAAPKLLHPLSPGHILRRKLEEPELLLEIKQRSPGELLAIALESYDRPRTGAEIRRTLSGIVGESEWSSWWSAARRDPQVLTVGQGSRQAYTWAKSGESAVAEIRQAFTAAEPQEKLDIFRKNAGRSAELQREMAETLLEIAESAVETQPNLAITAWYALEKAGIDLSAVPWSPTSLIASSAAPASLLTGLPDRALREKAYRLIREARSEWEKVLGEVMAKEEDPRLLDALSRQLGEEGGKELQSFVDTVVAQPRKHPAAFVWLAENANAERLSRNQNPLRWLQQILDAPHHKELAPYRARIARLLGSGGPILHLLSSLDEEQAAKAETAVERAPFEEYLRSPLINALHLRFSSLGPPIETPLYALPDSITARRATLKELLEKDIPTNRRAIEEARELGDLSENFEYKSARQRHEYLTARAASLEQDLSRVKPFDSSLNDASEVRAGCRLELEGEGEERRTLTILGPWESQPEDGIISYESDLAQEIQGKRVGDSVELSGQSFRVAKIEPVATS